MNSHLRMSLSRFSVLIFSVVLLLMGAKAFAGAIPDDVAINPTNGDTFILQVGDNPSGELLILNDFNETYEERVNLYPGIDSSARFELEITPSNEVVYLVQSGDRWYLNSLERRNGKWASSPFFKGITGEGRASALTSLPDGNLALRVERDRTNATVQVVRATRSEGPLPSFEVVDSVSEAKMAEKVKELVARENRATSEGQMESGNGLGFGAGALSGVGIAYRRHFASKWGVQVAGIAFGDASSLLANLGVNLMRTLSRTQKVRFYALAGVSTFYSGSEGYSYPVCDPSVSYDSCAPVSTGWQNSGSLNFGAGIGMEFELTKSLGLAVELPVTVMLDFGREGLEFGRVYPIPSAALIYYF